MDNKDMLATFARKGVEGLRAKAADVQISVDAQGGFALPTEVASNIIRLQHESSPIRQLVGGISTSTTDYSQLVSIGGSASGWVGETAARPNTGSPELAKISAVFGEVYASPKAYQHVLEDSFFNVEAWLAGEVAREFSEQENSAFLNGNGTNKPVGILNGLDTTAAYIAGDATRAFGKYQVIKSGVATNLGATSDAVINLLRSVVLNTKTGYLGNAKWMMSRATHNVLVDLKTTDGEYFLQRDITVAAAGRIFGYEIVINEDMAEIGAGNMPIVFGDFAAGYQVVDRVGVSMLRDPYSAHGAISFYTRKRVGSMLLNTEALKVVAIAA
jgi:HK97 family phage major capsid protein